MSKTGRAYTWSHTSVKGNVGLFAGGPIRGGAYTLRSTVCLKRKFRLKLPK